MATIVEAESAADVEEARELFLEYARSLDFSLCFQGFDEELAALPGCYAPPTGRLLLARIDGAFAGCVGLRDLGNAICEMKRLYVRSAFRGTGLGRVLAEKTIAEARAIGYSRMRLDTLPSMATAIGLYDDLGFTDIPPYCYNPGEGAMCKELVLHDRQRAGEAGDDVRAKEAEDPVVKGRKIC